MAEGKKSFVLYSDLIHTVKKLPNEKAGELFKVILQYVNDENPIIEDLLIDLTFEPIKQQLKRDLRDWESKRQKRAEAGRIGGLKSGESRSTTNQNEANEANASNSKQNEANEAVNVNGNVTVNGNVKDIEKRKLKFASTLEPFIDKYGKKMIRDFYEYWTEPNKSNTKFKMELEKTWSLSRRLDKWDENQGRFSNGASSNQLPQQDRTKQRQNAETALAEQKEYERQKELERQSKTQ